MSVKHLDLLKQQDHHPPPPPPHQHKWEPFDKVLRSQQSASPCSRLDDHLWDEIIHVQSCACGAFRYLLIGFKNRRRRGDDMRRSAGKNPLGTPLERSGIYETPRVLRVVEPK